MHLNSNRLLIVDGDSITSRHVHQLATKLDYTVEEAHTVADALNCIENFRPSLIILDLGLPETDGIAMLTELGKAGCTAAKLLLSHQDRAIIDTAKSIAIERGWQVLGCISKPVYPPELAGWLKVALTPKLELSRKTISSAIENEEFLLQYQPTLHSNDGLSWHITGVVGYVRWQHPNFGLLRPAVFLAGVRNVGLLSDLTDQLMHQAIRDAQFWQNRGLSLTVGLCIPRNLLKTFHIINRLEALTSEYDVSPDMLVLSILDADGQPNFDIEREALIRLRLGGFQLAYDGFHNMRHSIAELAQMSFTIINLDSLLVPHSDHDESSASTVSAVLAIARYLGMEVHAKGITNEADLDLLASLGCRAARGNLFSSEIPAAEVESFVRKWNSLSVVTVPVAESCGNSTV